jgi:hypothetical protein
VSGPARFGVALSALAALAAVSCDGSLSPSQVRGQRAGLTVARQRWAAQGPANYRYRFQYLCFCPSTLATAVEIQVRAGRVVAVLDPETRRPVTAEPGRPTPTVEELFAVVEQAIARPVDWFDVQYDLVLGYPAVIRLDPNTRTVDEETSYFAGSLTAIP